MGQVRFLEESFFSFWSMWYKFSLFNKQLYSMWRIIFWIKNLVGIVLRKETTKGSENARCSPDSRTRPAISKDGQSQVMAEEHTAIPSLDLGRRSRSVGGRQWTRVRAVMAWYTRLHRKRCFYSISILYWYLYWRYVDLNEPKHSFLILFC